MEIGDLRLRVPVIQGGMGVGVSLSGLAGAVAKEGGAGIISTAQIGFQEKDFDTDPLGANLRAVGKELAKARRLAPEGIIGVNIMVATQHYEKYVEAAVKAGADLIISGAGLPMTLPELTAGSRTKLAPIVSSKKAAEVICRYWQKKYDRLPDLVVIEGPRAGGHLGFKREDLETLTVEDYDTEIRAILHYLAEAGAARGIRIPAVVAGGVYDRKDLEHCLELGADGVQVATRFVTTYECDAPEAFKRAYLNAKQEDIVLVNSPVGMPGRAIRNAFIERSRHEKIPHGRCHACIRTCKPEDTPYCITEALIRAVSGDTEEGMVFCGSNAYRAQRLEHVADIMAEFAGGKPEEGI